MLVREREKEGIVILHLRISPLKILSGVLSASLNKTFPSSGGGAETEM